MILLFQFFDVDHQINQYLNFFIKMFSFFGILRFTSLYGLLILIALSNELNKVVKFT